MNVSELDDWDEKVDNGRSKNVQIWGRPGQAPRGEIHWRDKFHCVSFNIGFMASHFSPTILVVQDTAGQLLMSYVKEMFYVGNLKRCTSFSFRM